MQGMYACKGHVRAEDGSEHGAHIQAERAGMGAIPCRTPGSPAACRWCHGPFQPTRDSALSDLDFTPEALETCMLGQCRAVVFQTDDIIPGLKEILGILTVEFRPVKP